MIETKNNIVNWKDDDHFGSDLSLYYGESPLVELKVSTGESKIVVVWDGYAEQVRTHSIKQVQSNYKQTVLCRDGNCPLCIVGEKVYARLLIPVYSVGSGDVEILQFLKFDEYKSLYSQVKSILKQADFPLALEICREDIFAYDVRKIEIPGDKLASIKTQVESFLNSIKDGTTTMSDIFKEVDNSLLNDPSLRRKLEFKGYDYKKFLVEDHSEANSVADMFAM